MAFTLAEAVIKVFIPQDQVRGELARTEQEAGRSAERIGQKMATAFEPRRLFRGFTSGARNARRALVDVSAALSGTAAIASLFARQGSETQRSLQAVSLALSGAGTAARALGGILRLLASHPLLAAATAILALIFASDKLKQAWETLRAVAVREWLKVRDVVLEVVEATKEVIRGYIEMVSNFARLRFDAATQGMNRMNAGLDRLKAVAPDARDAAIDLGKRGLDFLKNVFSRMGDQANEALQKALKVHDLTSELSRASIQAQIADLQRIRAEFAKTAEERMEIDVRVFRLREQLRKQDFARSMDFVNRLIAEGRAPEEIITAFRRVIAKAKGDAEALAAVQKAMADFELRTRKESRDKIIGLQQDVRAQIEALTLNEFEVKRRAIQREFEERRKVVLEGIRLGTASAADLVAIERAKNEALKGIAKEEIAAAAEKAKAKAEEAVRVVDIERELGRATITQAIAAREALLTDKTLVLTAEERLRLEKEIRDLRKQQAEDIAARDPLAGLRASIDETRQASTNWKQVWTSAIGSATSSVEGFFSSIQRGSKTVMEAAQDAVTGVLDAVLSELNKLAASAIIKWILGGLPLGKGGLIAGGGLFGMAGGGLLHGLVVAAQKGLVAKGPTLAALAEQPGLNELVMPLPTGLRPQDLAAAIQRGGGAAGQTVEGDVNVTYTGDMSFASAQDIRSHARIVADAVRMARRMNHPVIRGGEA